MKKFQIGCLVLFFLCGGLGTAWGDDYVDLWEAVFNIDGTLYKPSSTGTWLSKGAISNEPWLPTDDPFSYTPSFDWEKGLGSLSWTTSTNTTSTAIEHNFVAFFDHDLYNYNGGNTYFDETGSAANLPEPETDEWPKWEIDEPGYGADLYKGSGSYIGDIYDNVVSGPSFLDNRIFWNGTSFEDDGKDDVSMALGWTFSLNPGQTGTITLSLKETASVSYLADHDPGVYDDGHEILAPKTIYFSGDLTITGGSPGPAPIPEPATMLLVGSGLLGLAGLGRKRMKKQG